jgi:glutamyl-Q tRNA(Asp) synthetase
LSLQPSAFGLQPYIGRFAPSPTGHLHFGSLFAAVASFLDARHHGGRWLLRMEDLDTPRVVPGSAASILRTLEAFALTWDGEVVRQSDRLDRYAAALQRLEASGRTFQCSCSRRELDEHETDAYPGTCRQAPARPGPTSTRFRIDETHTVAFDDRVQGLVSTTLRSVGDVIVRRRDGLFAYQLAVVVDDAEQGVTDVVRGLDLLPSTAWQIELQRAIHAPQPRYAHVPLVVEPDGTKLAKSRRSVAVGEAGVAPSEVLFNVLYALGLPVPDTLRGALPSELVTWAIPRFGVEPLRGARTLPVPENKHRLGVPRTLY